MEQARLPNVLLVMKRFLALDTDMDIGLSLPLQRARARAGTTVFTALPIAGGGGGGPPCQLIEVLERLPLYAAVVAERDQDGPHNMVGRLVDLLHFFLFSSLDYYVGMDLY